MELVIVLFWQLASYSIVTWLFFVGIAFSTARCFPAWYIPIGHLVIAASVCVLDVRWIQAEMSQPDWSGAPDMDIVFYIGMVMRVFLINATLLPVSYLGVRLRKQREALNFEKSIA